MAKPKYPIGYKFNNLIITEYLGQIKNSSNHTYYKCKCNCGKEIIILSQHIQVQKSCGCMPRTMKKL